MRTSNLSSIALALSITTALAQDTIIFSCYDQASAEQFFALRAEDTKFFGTELAAFATELEANPGRFGVPKNGVELIAKQQAGVQSGSLPIISPVQFCMENDFSFDNTHAFPDAMATALRLVVDTCCGGQGSQTPCLGGRGQMKGDTGLKLNWYIQRPDFLCPNIQG